MLEAALWAALSGPVMAMQLLHGVAGLVCPCGFTYCVLYAWARTAKKDLPHEPLTNLSMLAARAGRRDTTARGSAVARRSIGLGVSPWSSGRAN